MTKHKEVAKRVIKKEKTSEERSARFKGSYNIKVLDVDAKVDELELLLLLIATRRRTRATQRRTRKRETENM